MPSPGDQISPEIPAECHLELPAPGWRFTGWRPRVSQFYKSWLRESAPVPSPWNQHGRTPGPQGRQLITMADLIDVAVRDSQVRSLVLSTTFLIRVSCVTSLSLSFPNGENANICSIELLTGSVPQSGVPPSSS